MTANVPAAAIKGWKAVARGTPASLVAVAVSVSDASDLWAVGSDGAILHTADHGRTFVRCTLPSHEDLSSVWAASKDDVWILGTEHVFHIENRTTVATLPVLLASHCGTPKNAVFGRAPNEVWIANGAILRTKDGGVTWARLPACGAAFVDGCSAEIDGTPEELWVDCPFNAARGDGSSWSIRGWPPVTEEQMHVSVSADDVWVVGQNSHSIGRSLDHGASWSMESLEEISFERRLWSIWSAGHGWAWIVADGVWVRRGALPWTRDSLPNGVNAVGGRDESDVWAVGAEGLVLHRQ